MATPKYNWKWILRSFSTAHPRVCTLFVALCINAVVPASLSVCAFSIELECLCHGWHALQWTFLTCDGGLPHLHPYWHSPFFLRFEISIGSGLDFLSLASSFMFLFLFFGNIWRLLRIYGWKKWKKREVSEVYIFSAFRSCTWLLTDILPDSTFARLFKFYICTFFSFFFL